MADTIGSVRPRLKADVFFVPLADEPGAYCLSGGEVLILTGESTYAWLERLGPYLTGQHRVDDLTRSLSPERREMVEGLVSALSESNLVRDVAADETHSLTAEELVEYANEIAFVEGFRDSPAHRFERYRNTRTVVVGAGPIAAGMVRAASDTGIRAVTAALTGTRSTDVTGAGHALGPDGDPERLRPLVAGADLVIHVADESELARAVAIDRLCAELRIRCVQALIVGDAAWIGPVTDPDRPDTRWEHLWRRLRPEGTGAASPFVTGPVPAIVANHAVFAAFEQVTGVAEGGAPVQATRLCLETLRTESHLVVAHPLTYATEPPDEAAFRTRIKELEAGASIGDEEFGERAETIADDLVGVFGTVDEQHFDQFPLRVAKATVADPVGLLGGRRQLIAVAAGWEYEQVRYATARRAVELYCSLMVDTRRLVTADGRRAPSAPVDPSILYTYGQSLTDGSVRLIPATLVYPALGAVPDVYHLLVGTAAGSSWSAAVEAALLAHCRELSIARAAAGAGRYRTVDLASVDLDEPASHYRELVDTIELPVTVHDVTSLAAVPAFAFRLGGGTTCYGVGLTVAEAVGAGLAQVLLTYQARFSDDAPYVPPPQPAPAGDPAPDAPSAAAPLDAPPDRVGALVDAVTQAGFVPVVVPLDHDPAVHTVLPYVARVVLLND